MKITIAEIKLHAKFIKNNNGCGRSAWVRLENYLKNYDNIHIMWSELTIHRGCEYKSISKIIGHDYFF